jgi:hypothetical protein
VGCHGGGSGDAADSGCQLALAEAAAALVAKTIRKALFDVLVLGGSTAVNAYRDELQKSAAGRVFVTITDIAFLGLAARDIYRLFSSGVLTKLIKSAGEAILQMGANAPRRLLEMYDGWRAFATAMTEWVKRGFSNREDHDGSLVACRPAGLELFRTSRAELAEQRARWSHRAGSRHERRKKSSRA